MSTTSSIKMVFKAMELEEKKGPRQKKKEREPGTGDGSTPTSTGLRVGEELQRLQISRGKNKKIEYFGSQVKKVHQEGQMVA